MLPGETNMKILFLFSNTIVVVVSMLIVITAMLLAPGRSGNVNQVMAGNLDIKEEATTSQGFPNCFFQEPHQNVSGTCQYWMFTKSCSCGQQETVGGECTWPYDVFYRDNIPWYPGQQKSFVNSRRIVTLHCLDRDGIPDEPDRPGYPRCKEALVNVKPYVIWIPIYPPCIGSTPTPTPDDPPPPPPGYCDSLSSDIRDCYTPSVVGACAIPYAPYSGCCCKTGGPPSPLIIDLDGNGFQFTNAAEGVLFDMRANGQLLKTAWPIAASSDGWLALDRNSNGTIDNVKELFGDLTQQNGDPMNRPNNGFNALRYFDESLNGGNEDGLIDWHDNVYNSLRIWVDANHNGVSEANELRTMQTAGVDSIDLNYYESQLADVWDNRFKYKSQAWSGGWKTICDVYPTVQTMNTVLFSQYEPIKVCDGTGLGTTMLGWSAPGIANTQIRLGSSTGTLFAQGGSSGRAQTGKWVTNGLTFYLINSSNGSTIGTYTANVPSASCPNFEGYVNLESNCNNISGWAADRNQLNGAILVALYDWNTPIAVVLANQSRPDVGSYLGDNGMHGFSFVTPASLRDGSSHSVSVRFSDFTTILGNSPRTISCPPIYEGYVDQINCGLISGWAANRNQPNVPVQVMLFKGNTYLMTIMADQLRGDVGAYLGDNGMHGFTIPTPAALKGGTNTVHVKFMNQTQLGNSPRYNMTCQ
jgi:hypothetical protein